MCIVPKQSHDNYSSRISNNNAPSDCEICFRKLSPDANGINSGLALTGCGHWFCRDCWQRHLTISLHRNSNLLQCPVRTLVPSLFRFVLNSHLSFAFVSFISQPNAESNPLNITSTIQSIQMQLNEACLPSKQTSAQPHYLSLLSHFYHKILVN